jgi:UDP:flavonoid glycosyltransferase YjiC (YdhE family)
MGAVIEADGFTAFEGGTPIEVFDAITPLVPVDIDAELRVMREGFVRRSGPRAEHVIELCRSWQPDVVVCDETDFGARVAAEVVGIPRAAVSVIANGAVIAAADIGAALDEVRVAHGLAPGPLRDDLYLVPGPPSFRDPAYPLPPNAVAMRPAALEATDAPLVVERPPVYFTLGSVFNMESGDLFDRVLRGLRDVDVIATTGSDLDPAVLGPQPPNVRIERFIPQAAVLASASAVVSHAGSGSVLGALAFGLPSLLIPMGADQPFNAQRAEALGVARVLDPLTCTPDDVRRALREVLDDPSYRVRAAELRAETLALPGSADILPLLTNLR